MTEKPRALFGMELKPDVMIKPKALPFGMLTPEGKAAALRVVQKFIAEHRKCSNAYATDNRRQKRQ